MIKIIPWASRKMSLKSLRKIWNLFPEGEICMTELKKGYEKERWQETIALYYINRGREFSIEIDPVGKETFAERLFYIGVKKFYFIWRGIEKEKIVYSYAPIIFAKSMLKKYKDAEITIVYEPKIDNYQEQEKTKMDESLLQTEVSTLLNFCKDTPRLKCSYRRVHPCGSKKRKNLTEKLEDYINKSYGESGIVFEPFCGCTTITPNNRIYKCPYAPRRLTINRLGHSLRDPFVLGSLYTGIRRNIQCDYCKHVNSQNKHPIKRLQYKNIGGE